jgi:5-methylcytosine-specific restriction protein A
MAKKICNEPGCNELMLSGTYCNKHKSNRHKFYREIRTDREELKFYSSNCWRRLRNYKIKIDPLCKECWKEGRVTRATRVHHIKEIKECPELKFNLDNLESVCDSCHNKIHKMNKRKKL